MTEIDFLPAEYWNRRQSQRDQWYLLGIGVASLILLLASAFHEAGNASQIRAKLAAVETEYKEALVQVEEVTRLETRRAPLATDAKIHSLLRARPSLSRVAAAIATSCPPRLSLNTVRVRPVKLNRSETKTAVVVAPSPGASAGPGSPDLVAEQLERFQADRDITRLAVELTGIAESDLDVTDLLAGLDKAGCFSEVKVLSIDFLPIGVLELREFKVHCMLAEVF